MIIIFRFIMITKWTTYKKAIGFQPIASTTSVSSITHSGNPNTSEIILFILLPDWLFREAKASAK